MEDWRVVSCSVNGTHWVSDQGRVWSCTHGRKFLRLNTTHSGYLDVDIAGKKRVVHRLVAKAFLGERNGQEVNHKNGNKKDNRLENLEWCTRSENLKHRHRVLGYYFKRPDLRRGVRKNPMSKKIMSISPIDGEKKLYECVQYAAEFHGITPTTIARVASGKKHCLSAAGLKWVFV